MCFEKIGSPRSGKGKSNLTKLPDLSPEDPLLDRLFGLAVQRLAVLQKCERFRSLLQEYRNLAIHIAKRAGSKTWDGENKVAGRFKSERFY
jgi:hypothetical protein